MSWPGGWAGYIPRWYNREQTTDSGLTRLVKKINSVSFSLLAEHPSYSN